MIERIDSERVAGESEESVRAFIESDYRIRQGICPNGHGLMTQDAYGQTCPECGFWTNRLAEHGQAQ